MKSSNTYQCHASHNTKLNELTDKEKEEKTGMFLNMRFNFCLLNF